MSEKYCPKCGFETHEVYYNKWLVKHRCQSCDVVYSSECLRCAKVEHCDVINEVELRCGLFKERLY